MDLDDLKYGAKDRPRRKVKLTFTGKEFFEQTATKFWNRQRKIRKKLEGEMKEKVSDSKQSYLLQRDRICRLMAEYGEIHEEFMCFLERLNSDESDREMASQNVLMCSLEDKVNDFMQELDSNMTSFTQDKSKSFLVKPEPQNSKDFSKVDFRENKSSRSKISSHQSHASSHHPSLAQQRLEAEEAKAKLEYAQKEAKLKKEQASIQVDLEVLEVQRDASVAEAKLRALESMQDCISVSSQSIVEPVVDTEDPMEHTRKFIEEINQQQTECITRKPLMESTQLQRPQTSAYDKEPTQISDQQHEITVTPNAKLYTPTRALNPLATDFEPKNNVFDITSFLLKKELMINKLVNFDDKPENFMVWKTSFKSVILEASVSPSEELDLLIRWLGPESKEHARRVKMATIYNPAQGCKVLWKRLEERYGSPELIESLVKLKLEKFPKINNSEMKKLFELSDLLYEIKALKENPKYEALFSYFDTSVGVQPVVQKLTYNLQSRWTTKASKYKHLYSVPCPPFSVFCDFIEESASMLNDPGLVPIVTQEVQDPKISKPHQHNFKQFKSVTVKKTDFKESEGDHKVAAKRCPIHDANHTLNQCRAFRKKSIRETKQYLREHNFCYKCCESDAHIFKACHAEVKCDDCGSAHHPTALHPSESYQGQRQHGGEGNILTKCTAICGEQFSGRSCAKAVLVDVYTKERPAKRLRLYALVDDQSNTTIGRSELFDYMGVPTSQTHSFTLTSCAGRIQSSGRRASGLMIAAVDGYVVMELPTITECNEIPAERHEIPTRSHTASLASKRSTIVTTRQKCQHPFTYWQRLDTSAPHT